MGDRFRRHLFGAGYAGLLDAQVLLADTAELSDEMTAETNASALRAIVFSDISSVSKAAPGDIAAICPGVGLVRLGGCGGSAHDLC